MKKVNLIIMVAAAIFCFEAQAKNVEKNRKPNQVATNFGKTNLDPIEIAECVAKSRTKIYSIDTVKNYDQALEQEIDKATDKVAKDELQKKRDDFQYKILSVISEVCRGF